MASLEEFMSTPSSTILKHVLAKQVMMRGGAMVATHVLSWVMPQWFKHQQTRKTVGKNSKEEGGTPELVREEVVRDDMTAFLDPLQIVVEAARLAIDVALAVGMEAARVNVGNFPSPAHVMIYCDSRYQRTCPMSWRWIFSCMPMTNSALEVASSTVIGGFREWLAIAMVEKGRLALQGLARDLILYHATGTHNMPARVSFASAGVQLTLGIGFRVLAEWATSKIGMRLTGFGLLHDVLVTSSTQIVVALAEAYLHTWILNPIAALRVAGEAEKYLGNQTITHDDHTPFPVSACLEFNQWSSHTHDRIVNAILAQDDTISHNERIKRLRILNRLLYFRIHTHNGKIHRAKKKDDSVLGHCVQYQVKPDTLTVEDLRLQVREGIEGGSMLHDGACLQCRTDFHTKNAQVGMPIFRTCCGHFFCSQDCLDNAPPDMLCRYCGILIVLPMEKCSKDAQLLLEDEWQVVRRHFIAMKAREGMLIPARLQMASWQIAAGYAVRQKLIRAEHCWYFEWDTKGVNPTRSKWVYVLGQFGPFFDISPTDGTVEVFAGHF